MVKTLRVLKDIPELVEELREQRARSKDYIVKATDIQMDIETTEITNDKGEVEETKRPVLRVKTNGDTGMYDIQNHVHGQLAGLLELHGTYYRKMMDKGALDLLKTNVNYWFDRRLKFKQLVRTIDGYVRSINSNKFRLLDHLELVTAVVPVISGRDGELGDEKPYARGAKCFSWALSPTLLNLCFVNPMIQVDLNDLDKGVQIRDDYSGGEAAHTFLRAGTEMRKLEPGQPHIVFPSCRVRNSETGHGGLSVQPGLAEAICSNAAWIGKDLAARHLGKAMESDEMLSSHTYKKMNDVVFSKVADITRSVFDPDEFLKVCKKFKGLEEIEINPKEAADQIATLNGMTEELRDDILAAYEPISSAKDTVMDIQRAVTQAAQKYSESDSEKQYLLESIGGQIIEDPKVVVVGSGK